MRKSNRFKKAIYKPHLKQMWWMSPRKSAKFVAYMENVLEIYSRPFDEKGSVVCMDEKSFQLLNEYIEPIPMIKDNHTEKCNCEYARKGSCSIFMFTELLAGWHEAQALPHRTALAWAAQMKWLVDEAFPTAKKIVSVMDNLNTAYDHIFLQSISSSRAGRLSPNLETHYIFHGEPPVLLGCYILQDATQSYWYGSYLFNWRLCKLQECSHITLYSVT